METMLKLILDKLNSLDQKVDRMDQRLTSVERGITALDGRLTSVEQGITTLDGRLTSVEQGITVLDGRLTSVEQGITALDGRLTSVEQGITVLDERLTTVDERLTAELNRQGNLVHQLIQTVAVTNVKITETNEQLIAVETKVDAITEQLKEIKNGMASKKDLEYYDQMISEHSRQIYKLKNH